MAYLNGIVSCGLLLPRTDAMNDETGTHAAVAAPSATVNATAGGVVRRFDDFGYTVLRRTDFTRTASRRPAKACPAASMRKSSLIET
jgi:hypothetical protein